MRTEQELWDVVLEHQYLFETGLCYLIDILYYFNVISWKELLILEEVLSQKSTGNYSDYWIGPKGEIQPRIDWINNRIKELS